MSQHTLPGREINSVILIDKPAGLTSSETINRARRILGIKKIGHSGTLDKFATGLLVVCTGSATKLTRYFLESDKRYTGEVRLGVATDSCDTEGDITGRCDISHLTPDDIRSALEKFRGEIKQRPPSYSALKINGRRASDLARSGEDVLMEERQVTVYSLDVLDINFAEGIIRLDIYCSKGTYIRSLARDIGLELGVCAHLQSLRRVSSGMFNVADALTLERLAGYKDGTENAEKSILDPVSALSDFSRMVLNPEGVRKALNGADFLPEQVLSCEQGSKKLYVILDGRKNLIAIADINIGKWQIVYRNVFNTGTDSIYDTEDTYPEE